MNTKTILIVLALCLLYLGITKKDFIHRVPSTNTVVDNSISPPEPPDYLKDSANKVVEILKNNPESKKDAKVMKDLYLDIATLISLDGDKDVVIKTTEEIRQANSLSTLMINLNIKDKYPNYAQSCNSLLVTSIGDDSMLLTTELRKKAIESFQAIAWAWYTAAK